MTRGEQILEQALLWEGTPVLWQHSLRGVGADCKGLIAGCARELDFPEARSLEAMTVNYGHKVDSKALLEGLMRLFDKVPKKGPLMPGDVVVLKIEGTPCHLGIYAPSENGFEGDRVRVIEALCRGPSRVQPTVWLKTKVHSAWRWRKAEDATS